MFKESQKGINEDYESQMDSRSFSIMQSPRHWSNVFYWEVVCQIEEKDFNVLYHVSMGRPNVPLRVLIGMYILKESKGLSDRSLYENCRYNLLYRRSLGIGLGDTLPSRTVYYEFLRKVKNHEDLTGEDLLKKSYEQLTARQCLRYGVEGGKVRGDSTLVASNIKSMSRFSLIVEVLRYFIESLSLIEVLQIRVKYDALLEDIISSKGKKREYRWSKAKKLSYLKDLGRLIGDLLAIFEVKRGSEAYELLHRVYNDQYEEDAMEIKEEEDLESKKGSSPSKEVPIETGDLSASLSNREVMEKESSENSSTLPLDGLENSKEERSMEVSKEECLPNVKLKPNEAISGKSLQSLHDRDAEYRNKGYLSAQGFSVDILETVASKGGLNLIISAQGAGACYADSEFFQPSIETAERISDNAVETSNHDGGYFNQANQEFVKEKGIDWVIPAMPGKASMRFVFDQKGEQIILKDIKDDTTILLTQKTKGGNYKYQDAQDQMHYFKPEQIKNSFIRQQIQNRSVEQLNVRANVEASIRTLKCHLDGGKMLYRGIFNLRRWLYCRVMGINFSRILKVIQQKAKKAVSIGIAKEQLCPFSN